MRERRRGEGWRTVPVGWTLWLPRDELRAEWQGSARAQYLFISTNRVEQLVDGPLSPERPGRLRQAPVVQKLLDAMAADLEAGSLLVSYGSQSTTPRTKRSSRAAAPPRSMLLCR